jgi:hypothetical protein
MLTEMFRGEPQRNVFMKLDISSRNELERVLPSRASNAPPL